jgi:hypothetical protein
MAASAPVTPVTVPPPAVGGTDASSAAPSAAANVPTPAPVTAPAPAAAAPTQGSGPVLSSDAAKIILAQQPAASQTPQPTSAGSQAASVQSNSSPTAQQIQAALAQLLQQLDNQPEEHPNAPAVVLLQNKETALRAALTQVSLGTPGPGQAYLSGVVLNAEV